MPVFSPQQQQVIDFPTKATGSTFVEAVAGSGKTTTLMGTLPETTGTVAFAAYNTKIVKEIKQKLADYATVGHKNFDPRFVGLGNRVTVGTFHSFGFAAWRKVYPRVEVDKGYKKQGMAINEFIIPKYLQNLVFKLVGLAKQQGAGLLWQVDDHSNWFKIVDHFDLAYEIEQEAWIVQAIEFAIKVIRFDYKVAKEIITFDDMIWLPLVSGCRVWQNDWIFVDEAQDTNPARRALARKMLKPNGRAIFVGDRHQAIYGFTGADADAIDQITRDFNCGSLPLTVTFRCPKKVVALAQTVVSHIQAHDSAPDGTVRDMTQDAFIKMGNTLHPTDDAILCRNTKPLVAMAFQFIKKGIACHVEGRDIGQGLIKLVNRFKADELHQLHTKLALYGETEVEKLKAKGKETQAEALLDRIETIFVLMSDPSVKSPFDLRQRITSLFLDSENEAKPTLCLCTCHRSKGREWKRVFILGYDSYMPSKYARQQWQLDQEYNLKYVAVTRAMEELVLVQVAE